MKWPPQDTGVFEISPSIVCDSVDEFLTSARGMEYDLVQFGGVPEIVGYESSPPKYYNKITISGEEIINGGGQSEHYICSGTYTIDPITGVAANSMTVHALWWAATYDEGVDTRCLGGHESIFYDYTSTYRNGEYIGWGIPDDTEVGFVGEVVKTRTSTSSTEVGTGGCGNQGRLVTGSVQYVLSEEDTEELAFARYFAAHPFSDFVGGETHAIWGFRNAYGFSWPYFSYNEVKWRKRQSGLLPLTVYNVSVEIWRRASNTEDTFALYATQTESGTTDAVGMLEVIGTVPNSLGFETYAKANTVLVTPI